MTTPIEVATPYLDTSLRDVQIAQEANIAYFVHPDFPTYKLSRTSATSFTFARAVWADGKAPLRAQNITPITITVTGAGPFTLTASAALFDAGTSDNGRAVRVKISAGNEAWYQITSTSSTTVATADQKFLVGTVSTAGATADWQLGMESDEEGFRAVTFHESRLWFGGTGRTGNNVDRIAGSDSDDFEKFSNDATLDDNAIYRRVTSNQINPIQWLEPVVETLHIGTARGEFKLVGENQDLITPSGAKVRPVTKRGSIHHQPSIIGNVIYFIQRNARKFRNLVFNLSSDKQVARDVSILSEHILENGGGGVELAYQQDPNSILWAPRADGQLVGTTIEEEQEVIAPHRHILGGSFQGDIAVCESAAVVPAPDGSSDQLWLVVKRTIGGVTKRYIEFMKDQFQPNLTLKSTLDDRMNATKSAWFLDCALELNDPKPIVSITLANPAVVEVTAHGWLDGDQVYLDNIKGTTELNDTAFIIRNPNANDFELETLGGAAVDSTAFTAYIGSGEAREMVTTVSGLSHLEGEVVGVFVNGSLHPDRTVTDGAVTLNTPAHRAVVGYKRQAFGETQRFVGGSRIGTDQGAKARTPRVNMRVHNTLGLKIGTGPTPEVLDDLIVRDGPIIMDRAPPVETGDFNIPVEGEWGLEPTIYWEQNEPLPYTIISIAPRAESNED